MKTKIIITALLLISTTAVFAQQNFMISGFARNYTGLLLENPNEFSIVQNTFDLNFENRTSRTAFKVNPYMYHYFDKELEFGLREAYLDMYFKNFDIRVGKQQIIWGKADGVFITDIVSPKDLREFLLPDFDEIRTGITSVKMNYYSGSHSLEAVWAPVFTPTLMPDNNSIWAPEMSFLLEPDWDYSTATVAPSIENSELFLRYSLMGSALDLELVGGYFFYDDPAMHITKQIDPESMQLTNLTVRPEYHRVAMAGGSIGMPIGALVLRSEAAYYSGRNFQTQDLTIPDAVIEKDNLHYMAGLDYSIAGTQLSAQFIQEYIIDYGEDMRNDEFENTMTFLAKRDFFREKLWLELFAYIGINNEDALIRPKISYSFADGFDVLAGANFFVGETGRFGQYSNNDMIYLKLKYSF